MFACMKQDHKNEGKGYLPSIAIVQILDVKHRTGLSVIYHNKMDNMEQVSTNILMSILV